MRHVPDVFAFVELDSGGTGHAEIDRSSRPPTTVGPAGSRARCRIQEHSADWLERRVPASEFGPDRNAVALDVVRWCGGEPGTSPTKKATLSATSVRRAPGYGHITKLRPKSPPPTVGTELPTDQAVSAALRFGPDQLVNITSDENACIRLSQLKRLAKLEQDPRNTVYCAEAHIENPAPPGARRPPSAGPSQAVKQNSGDRHRRAGDRLSSSSCIYARRSVSLTLTEEPMFTVR